MSGITKLSSSLLPWCSLNCLNGWHRGNISRVDCWNGCTQIWGGANSTKVEQLTFGGDCRGGCMHNQGCENKGAITIL